MIRLTLRGSTELTAPTIDQAVTNAYGDNARLRWSADPNSPELAEVTIPSAYEPQVSHRVASVVHMEQLE